MTEHSANEPQFSFPMNKREARKFVLEHPGLVTAVARRFRGRDGNPLKTGQVSQVIYGHADSKRIRKKLLQLEPAYRSPGHGPRAAQRRRPRSVARRAGKAKGQNVR